ncbi:MAG: 4Fe-4S dicluster domain-containing protein [Deltaproteobacteria bacterium]|nr:4Fe-4S dicluster domain-containing protein [Deltaproteobacteria bacterium]
MTKLHNTLRIKYNECPPDCRLCEEACRNRGVTENISMISLVRLPSVEFNSILSCIQCGEPHCVEICPTGAITKSESDGIVRIKEEKCAGCGLCTLACPYGGIRYSTDKKKSFKCDLCDGDPECVKACPYGVLSLIENEPVTAHFQIEDPLSHGTTMCPGCPAEIAHRFTLRVLGKDVVLIGAPGCACAMILGVETPAGIKAPESVPCHMALLTNVASVMTGIKRYYNKIGKDIKVVSFVGDGATADIGFQPLSGAAERGENIIYICYDNEAYMNTGIQRSGTTPLGAWTTTTEVGQHQRGKGKAGKYVPLLMALHGGVSYTATAIIGFPHDYARKLKKAMEVKDGMAYIHLFSPCPVGWRAAEDSSIEMCEAAVETNYFPLWEAEKGVFRITHEVKNPKPVQEFTKQTGRFRHLAREDLDTLQQLVDKRMDIVRKLTEPQAVNIHPTKGGLNCDPKID